MSIKIGILELPSNKSYWSRELRCSRIADVMPYNRYQELLRYLHFVNNDSINAQDKLAKINPLISMVQDEFVKIEPEEYNSVDKQIIMIIRMTFLRKQSSHLSDNIIRRSQKSGDSKILFALASLVLCMTFSFMMGKTLQS